MPTSKYLSESAVTALDRIGGLMMPRDQGFPSFRELGVIAHIDDVVAYIPADDRGALNMLLGVLSIFPDFLLQGFLNLVDKGATWPAPLGGLFRQLNMGLKSVVVTLYFSGKKGRGYTGQTPLDVIGYHVNPVR